ncbi:hypothetical protein MKX03_018300 [Papaver bracteatum]|nr:hypothetical protein MKX03_018300 [Papaver bracteatum]
MGFYKLVSDSGESGNSRYLMYWNNSKLFWNSGEWDEESNTFLLIPEMRLNYNVNYTCISNVNESYFTYSLYKNSIMSRFVVDVSGQIKQLIWSERTKKWNLDWVQPEQSCRVYGICGPFGSCNQDTQKCECLPGFVARSSVDWSLQDTNGGCVRNMPLQCGSGDGFLPIPAAELPDITRSLEMDNAVDDVNCGMEI